MKKYMEKISILSLSLMLVSTFAVSPALPQMISHFVKKGISASQVELLVTVSSLAIMACLLLNSMLVRFLSERAIIVLGLLLIAVGGAMPVFLSDYGLIFLSRILLGLGIGMINARAINIIGTHFSGQERIHMLGLRGSSEVLGSAGLTILVGWLIGFGWQAAFLVYLFALPILFLFLAFVPNQENEPSQQQKENPVRLTKELWRMGLGLAFLAFFVINVNTFITIRIPIIVTDSHLGTAVQASWILSLMQLMGIISGALFGFLVKQVKSWLFPMSYFIFALAVIVIGLSPHLLLLTFGAVVSGFFYSVVLTIIFSRVTQGTPQALLNSVMTIVLMGCNIGGATASILPNLLEKLNPTATGAFGVYACACILISAYLIFQQLSAKKNKL